MTDRHTLSLFDETPSSPVSRYYQRDAESAIYRQLQLHRSTLLVLATGLGKTQTFCAVAAKAKGNVLVLAHRQELVAQAKARLELLTGEPVGVEMAGEKCGRERLVVGSVDTVKQKKRLERLGTDRFSLIIVDEAHHYIAKTYRRPLDYFRDAKVLGVTATPDRGDEKALGKLFDSVAYLMDISDGIDAGYLVPLTGKEVFLESVDLSAVKSTAGDLNIGQLDQVMVEACHGIVAETRRLAGDRRGIAFFPGVRSAEFACNLFNEQEPDSAVFLSGSTDPMLRESIVEQFKKGRWKYLCNCQIATEGFDAPDVSVIIHGRPTKSRALYAQMTGRGTRVLPGVVDHLHGQHRAEDRREAVARSPKRDCLILDFVGNAGKHALCSPVDLLGGDYNEAEVKAAKKLVKENGGSPAAALKEARRLLQEMARAHQAAVKARHKTFDPFALLHIRRDDPRLQRFSGIPATPAQVAALTKAGIENAESLSKGEAMRLMDSIITRRNKGLASAAQLKVLSRHGIDKVNISFARARAALDYMASTGWKPDPKVLQELVR